MATEAVKTPVAPVDQDDAIERFITERRRIKGPPKFMAQQQAGGGQIQQLLTQLQSAGPGPQGEMAPGTSTNFDPARLAPELGSIVGGIGGGLATANPLGAIGGAGLGAAAGSAVRDLARGQPVDVGTATMEGLTNAAYQGVGGLVVSGAVAGAKGLAGRLTPYADDVVRWWQSVMGTYPSVARELIAEGADPGLVGHIAKTPFTVGEVSTGVVPDIIESSGRAGLTGYAVMKEMGEVRNRFVDKIAGRVFNAASRMRPRQLVKLISRSVDDAYTAADDVWSGTYRKIFDESTVGNERVSTDLVKRVEKLTTKWLTDAGGPKAVPGSTFDAEMQAAVQNLSTNPTVSSLHRWSRVVGKRVFKEGDEEIKARFGHIYDAADKTIDRTLAKYDKFNGTTFAPELKDARQAIHDLKDVFSRGALGSLRRAFRAQTQGKLIKPGTVLNDMLDVGELKQFRDVVGPTSPEWKAMQDEFMFRLFSKARSSSSGTFNGKALESELKGLTTGSYGKSVYKFVLEPAQLHNAKQFAKFVDTIQQVHELSPIAKITQFGLLVGGGAASGMSSGAAMLLTWPYVAAVAARNPRLGAALVRVAKANLKQPRALAKAITAKFVQAGAELTSLSDDPDMKPRIASPEEKAAAATASQPRSPQ